MSIAYIGHSQAKPDEVEGFRKLISSLVMPAVRGSEGCASCQFFQSEDDPTKFVGIEIWASVEAHRAAVRNIPPGTIAEYRTLVAGAPTGGYYRVL